MEKLIEILEDIQPDADYENCTTLIDDGILESFAILSIVGELEDEFDISITPAEIIPENFNSAKALWAMVQRLQNELVLRWRMSGVTLVRYRGILYNGYVRKC